MVDYIKIGLEKGYIKIDEKEDKIYYLNTAPKEKVKYSFKTEDKWSDPEEKVRASVFVKLIEDFGFKSDHMAIEVEPDTSRPKYPADILIFNDDWNPYIVVETKAKKEDLDKAKEQGNANANLYYNKPQYIYVAGNSTDDFNNLDLVEYFYKKSGDELEEIPRIPSPKNTVEYFYYNVEKPSNSSQRILEKVEDKITLIRKFDLAHDIIWNSGQMDPSEAIDEFSKILFVKLKDELDTPIGSPYKFQIKYVRGKPDLQSTANDIRDFYNSEFKDSLSVLGEIKISDEQLIEIVKLLENISLIKTETDALGDAFETILSDTFRGNLGQYFTPREIINFMTDMVAPISNKRLIDPACGSGGFLEYATRYVRDKELKDENGNPKFIDFNERISNYVDNIAGIEISSRLSLIAKTTLSLYGKHKSPRIVNTTAFNSLKEYKPFIENRIEEHSFDLLMINPPFK